MNDRADDALPVLPRSAVPGVVWPAIPNDVNARILAVLYQFNESQWWPLETLRRLQYRQARALLRHARQTVPFYRERLPAALPETLTLAQIRDLPRLTKADIRAAGDDLLSRDLKGAHRHTVRMTTTGSTGEPITVTSTQIAGILARAAYQRSHIWQRRDLAGKTAAIRAMTSYEHTQAAVEGGQRLGWAAGYRSGPMRLFDITRPLGEQMTWLESENPDYLLSFAANLGALIEAYPDAPARLPRLKEVASMGETLNDEVRAACTRDWRLPLSDIYSCQEVGAIAIQCPDHAHYHEQSENLLVEILDEAGEPCGPGEIGRVVVTDLHNFAMPLIRYEVGDLARVGPACACGRGLPVLDRIMGRTRNMMRLANGERTWPSLGSKIFVRFEKIQQRQFVQTGIGRLTLRLVVSAPLDAVPCDVRERILIKRAFLTELNEIKHRHYSLNFCFRQPKSPVFHHNLNRRGNESIDN